MSNFEHILHKDIPELLKECNYSSDVLDIKYIYEGYTRDLNKEIENSLCTTIKVRAFLENKLTGETFKTLVDILHVPVETERGYKIGNSYKQILEVCDKAKGWYITKGKPIASSDDADEVEEFIDENIPSDESEMSFIPLYGKHLKFFLHDHIIYVGATDNSKVSIGKFLKALTGKSYKELLNVLGANKYIISSLRDETSVIDAVNATAPLFKLGRYKDSTTKASLLRTRMFNPSFLKLNSASRTRWKQSSSFANRALNRVLQEDINVNGEIVKAGTRLYKDILDKIDASNMDSLKINHNDKIFTLKKYHYEQGTLIPEELFTAINMFACTLDGLDVLDDEYALTSRVTTDYRTRILEFVRTNLYDITEDITSKADLKNNMETSLISLYSTVNKPNTMLLLEELTNQSNKEMQSADITNPIAKLSKENKITTNYGKSVSNDAISVQSTQWGKIDAIEAPESNMIGRTHYRTMTSIKDEDGFLKAPYVKIKNCEVVDNTPVYLTAAEELDVYIASWDETFETEEVIVKYKGDIFKAPRDKVTYKEYSCYQDMSIARAGIPFQNHDNVKRLLMGSNHQKQAVSIIKGERPIVDTGHVALCNMDITRAKDILKQYYLDNSFALEKSITMDNFIKLPITLIKTEYKDNNKILNFKLCLEDSNGRQTEKLITHSVPFMQKTDKETVYSTNINKVAHNIYKEEDIIAYNSGIDIKDYNITKYLDTGAMQLDEDKLKYGFGTGKNFLVAFKTNESSTIDDAIDIAESLVFDNQLTSISQKEIRLKLLQSDKFVEEFGFKNNPKEQYMQQNSLPKVGTYLKPGSLVLCKCRRNISANSKYSNKVEYEDKIEIREHLDNNVSGEVISAEIIEDEAIVRLASISTIEVADKLSGRHGNKGVIARIVPDDKMPIVKSTGERVQVLLNPLGIPSRMNIGQLLECALGRRMQLEGNISIISPFKKDDLEIVSQGGKAKGLNPEILIDGRTGMEFERPVNVGVMYMLKLEHMVNKKIHAIGLTNKINQITGQPNKGAKNDGGQAFGEYESWVLMSVGATKVLQDLESLQSDDFTQVQNVKRQIKSNPYEISATGNNNNDYALRVPIRCLGMEVSNDSQGNYVWSPLTDKITRALATNPLDVNDFDSLHDEFIFGDSKLGRNPKGKDKWGYIELGCELIHPTWVIKSQVYKAMFILDYKYEAYRLSPIKKSYFAELIEGNAHLVYLEGTGYNFPRYVDNNSLETFTLKYKSIITKTSTGMEAVLELFKLNTVENSIKELKAIVQPDNDTMNPGRVEYLKKNIDFVKAYASLLDWKKRGIDFKDYIISTLPIMPQIFRPQLVGMSREDDYDIHYKRIFTSVKEYKINKSAIALKNIYDSIGNFTGLLNTKNDKVQNVLKKFCGKNSDGKGQIRETLLSKRLHCSGRSVIIPSQNVHMPVTRIGVPILMAVEMWGAHLESLLSNNPNITDLIANIDDINYEVILGLIASENTLKFSRYVKLNPTATITHNELFFAMRKSIIEFLESRVVLSGRQPSLHKFSLRAYKPRITFSKAIELNPLVCQGYNADFDGDQMYVTGLLTAEASEEALEKLSPLYGVINPKDSSIIMEHSQDMLLGMYYSTMLYNNIEDIHEDKTYYTEQTIGGQAITDYNVHYYGSPQELYDNYTMGIIKLQDIATIMVEGRRYISTVGRLIFNSLIPNNAGFTDNPYDNTLKFRSGTIKLQNYHNLKYDGLIVGKSGNGKIIKYQSLRKINHWIYENYEPVVVASTYQKFMEFGFLTSDRGAISLGPTDVMIDVGIDKYIGIANREADKINRAYNAGLLSETGKKEALISIYDRLTKFTKDELVMNALDRNNNLFIISDSGARGSLGQITQTIGIVGVTMKTLSESLETPILSSYTKGLSSIELAMASFGGRFGVASTQLETSNAGYATRQTVFMLGGFKVVEADCGNKASRLELQYDGIKSITNNYGEFKTKDFGKTITLPNNKPYVVPSSVKDFLVGRHLPTDYEGEILTLMANFPMDDNQISDTCVEMILKHQIREVPCVREDGSIEVVYLKYELAKTFKDLLLRRYAEPHTPDLPEYEYGETAFTSVEVDLPYLEQGNYISEDTINYIENKNLLSINVRTMLSCRSEGGCCQHCYGLKFDKAVLPEINEMVGYESAQAIGEPASQLTMSLFHKGGVAGGSVSSGVAVYKQLLNGSLPKKDIKAIVAQNNGYVQVQAFGDKALVKGGGVLQTIDTKLLQVQDGEYVKPGQKLSFGFTPLDGIGTHETVTEDIIHKRQIELLSLYYLTFESQTHVHARHFELLTRTQTSFVTVLNSTNPEIVPGRMYEINHVKNALDRHPDSVVCYDYKIAKQEEVVKYFSGPCALIAFQRFPEFTPNLVTMQEILDNKSLIGKLAIGEDVTKNEPKVLSKPKYSFIKEANIETDLGEEEDASAIEIFTGDINIGGEDSDAFNMNSDTDLDLSGLNVFDLGFGGTESTESEVYNSMDTLSTENSNEVESSLLDVFNVNTNNSESQDKDKTSSEQVESQLEFNTKMNSF